MLIQYLFLLLLVVVAVIIADITRRKGFDNLKVYREVNNNKIIEGEDFQIKTTVENNKRLPLF